MNTMYETPDFPYGQQSFTSVPQQRESTFALREEDSVEAPLEDEILELDGMFTLDGYQVVRREFFAHINEPSVTFNNCKFNVNSACLSKFPNVEYVQVLVNMDTKILALRPSTEHERDSFCWCTTPKGKRKPRAITCKLFFAKVVSLMVRNSFSSSAKQLWKVVALIIKATSLQSPFIRSCRLRNFKRTLP